MDFKDHVWFRPLGSLAITRVEGDKRTLVYEDKNLVVDHAKEMMAKIISGVSGYHITHIALGTGIDPVNPTPPLPTDTELLDEQFRIPVELTFYPSFNSVTFRAFLRGHEGNGLVLTEAGLIAASSGEDHLYAKRNHGGVYKEADFALEYNWTITF